MKLYNRSKHHVWLEKQVQPGWSPVPANRSSHLVPGGSRGWLPAMDDTMLKTAPLTFSIMGLVPSPGGDTKRFPAAEPVMMRMLPTEAVAVFFFFLLLIWTSSTCTKSQILLLFLLLLASGCRIQLSNFFCFCFTITRKNCCQM